MVLPRQRLIAFPFHHCPVRVNAAQKKGFEKSFECNRVNCALCQALARDSPARKRRMNSVISSLVALFLAFLTFFPAYISLKQSRLWTVPIKYFLQFCHFVASGV